jgi:predicted dinucleotide-binding enzyme
MTVGIIGAGKVGIVLAQLALNAGYKVLISGSGAASKIALTVSVLAPGAVARTNAEVAAQSDVIILAIPLGKYEQLPKNELDGKLVIDAMNYWWEVDGIRPDLTSPIQTSSEVVQEFLHGSRVVKAFSHIGYHNLDNEHRVKGMPDRKAVALAGNSSNDLGQVAVIIDDFGFDPVVIGSLKDSRVLQPGGPIFGEHVDEKKLKQLLAEFDTIV